MRKPVSSMDCFAWRCVVQHALRGTYVESEPISHQSPDSEDRRPCSHHEEARSPDPQRLREKELRRWSRLAQYKCNQHRARGGALQWNKHMHAVIASEQMCVEPVWCVARPPASKRSLRDHRRSILYLLEAELSFTDRHTPLAPNSESR